MSLGDLVFLSRFRSPDFDVIELAPRAAPLSAAPLQADPFTSPLSIHISQLAGADFVLAPQNNGNNTRLVLRMPLAGGAASTYLDPFGDSTNATYYAGRITSEDKFILVYRLVSSDFTARARRFNTDTSLNDDQVLASPNPGSARMASATISPDGRYVYVWWYDPTYLSSTVWLIQYDLAAGASAVTFYVDGSGATYTANSGGFLQMEIGLGNDVAGNVLLGYNFEAVIGPDGLGRFSHPIDVRFDVMDPSGGLIRRNILATYDANPSNFTGAFLGPGQGWSNQGAGGIDAGANGVIWAWSWWDSFVPSPDGTTATFLVKNPDSSPTYYKWDTVTSQSLDLWVVKNPAAVGNAARSWISKTGW